MRSTPPFPQTPHSIPQVVSSARAAPSTPIQKFHTLSAPYRSYARSFHELEGIRSFLLNLGPDGWRISTGPILQWSQKNVDDLSGLLQSRQITRIEILPVPDNLETKTRITPGALRSISRTKVVLADPWESSSFKMLLASLQELRNAKSRENGEVRWAILLSDAAGQEISAIYLSSDGSLAIVQGASLSLRGELLT